jgi:hypothetical protein
MLEDMFEENRYLFSRDSTFGYYVLSSLGLVLRNDQYGVSSFIRLFELDGECYKPFLNFFRSDAWELDKLTGKWAHKIINSNLLYKTGDRPLFIIDGVKEPKEARRQPCVNILHQESGDGSKKEFIRGHLFGCVGLLIGNDDNQFSCPITLRIQGSEGIIRTWIEEKKIKEQQSNAENSDVENKVNEFFYDANKEPSHVVLNIRDACLIAEREGVKCYCAADAYYFSGPVLNELKEHMRDDNTQWIDIITRGRKDCKAYRQVGKKVKSVELIDVFDEKKSAFKDVVLNLYGKDETVSYYSERMLWNRKKEYRTEILFVFTVIDNKKVFLCTTDLTMDPELVIKIYTKRFKIETGFRSLKSELNGFGYHFWTKAMTKISVKATAEENREALKADGEASKENKDLILDTFKAMEAFVNLTAIGMGMLQIVSLTNTDEIEKLKRWQVTYRDGCPSEATVADILAKALPEYKKMYPNSLIAACLNAIEAKPEVKERSSKTKDASAK